MIGGKKGGVVQEKEIILFLGDAQVGKTSLIKRFLGDDFEEKYTPTVEDAYMKQFEINEWGYSIEFLDTSGRYTFPAMRRLNIARATSFVLVSSVAEGAEAIAMETVAGAWADICAEKGSTFHKAYPTVLVGNKTDLGHCEQSEDELKVWARDVGLSESRVIMTSARNENGVWDVFQSLWDQKVTLKTQLATPAHPVSSGRKGPSLFRSRQKPPPPQISASLLQMSMSPSRSTAANNAASPSRRRFSAFAGGLSEPKSPSRFFQQQQPQRQSPSINSGPGDRRNSRSSISKGSQPRGSRFAARSTEVIKLDCVTS